MELTSYYFWHILFVKRKASVSPTLEGRGIYVTIWSISLRSVETMTPLPRQMVTTHWPQARGSQTGWNHEVYDKDSPNTTLLPHLQSIRRKYIIPTRNVALKTLPWKPLRNFGGLLSKSWMFSLFVVVQSVSHVWLFVTPVNCKRQVSLSFTVSQSLVKLMSLIQWCHRPSYPLSPPSPALNLSQHQGLFQWVSFVHQVAKVLELQLGHQFFQWVFRVVFL